MGVHNDLAYTQFLSSWTQIDQDAVSSCLANTNGSVGKFATVLLHRFGMLHDARLKTVIVDSSLSKNFWQKRQIVNDVYKSLLTGVFDAYISVESSKGLPGSEQTFDAIFQSRLKLVRYFPMPCQQIPFAARKKASPVPPAVLDEYREAERRLSERLFEEVGKAPANNSQDDDEKESGLSAPDAEYQDFVCSKAGLIEKGQWYTWFDLVEHWGYHTNQRFISLKFLERIHGENFVFRRHFIPDLAIPKDAPFREYVVWRSIRAIEVHLELTLPREFRGLLFGLFMKDDHLRRKAVYCTSQETFIENYCAENSDDEKFLTMLAQFCKFRHETPDVLPAQKWTTIFLWLYESARPHPFDYQPAHIENAFEKAKELAEEAHLPRHQYFCVFSSLAKMHHYEAFAAFVKRVRAAIPALGNGFLVLCLERRFDYSDYAPWEQLFAKVSSALKLYRSPPPPDYFWSDLFRLDPEKTLGKIEEFVEFFQADQELNADFHPFFASFLEGRVEKRDLQILESFSKLMNIPVDSKLACSMLAQIFNPLAHPVDESWIAKTADTVGWAAEKYRFSHEQTARLFFELLTVPPHVGSQQLLFISMIEEFIGAPLRPDDAFHWLMYRPEVEKTGRVLKSFFDQRRQIIERHLDDFALPSPLLSAIRQNSPELRFLEPEGMGDGGHIHIEFQGMIVSLATQMAYAMLPYSINVLFDYVCQEAVHDRPFLCGEESRVTTYSNTLSPLNPDYPQEKAIWRGWRQPEDPAGFPLFTAHIVHLRTLHSQPVRAVLEVPLQDLEDDPSLYKCLHEVCLHLGEERHSPAEALPAGETIEDWLPLYPKLAPIWNSFAPKRLSKEEVSRAFFQFVKAVKIGFRKALIEHAAPSPPLPFSLPSKAARGGIYRIGDTLSLLPPNYPMTKRNRDLYTIGPEYGPCCAALRERVQEISDKTYEEFQKRIDDSMQGQFGLPLAPFCRALALAIAKIAQNADEAFPAALEKAIRRRLGRSYDELCQEIAVEAQALADRKDWPLALAIREKVQEAVKSREAYEEFCEALQKSIQGTAHSVEGTFILPGWHIMENLHYKIAFFLQTKERNSALNEVTLWIGPYARRLTVRYQTLAQAENFPEMIKWQIFLLIQRMREES